MLAESFPRTLHAARYHGYCIVCQMTVDIGHASRHFVTRDHVAARRKLSRTRHWLKLHQLHKQGTQLTPLNNATIVSTKRIRHLLLIHCDLCFSTFTLARLASLVQSLRRQLPNSPQAAVTDLRKLVSGLLSRPPEAGAGRSNGRMSTPENKSYLASGRTSRTATPQPTGVRSAEDAGGNSGESTLRPQRGGDHLVSHRHRLSLRNYPRDCPPLLVQWFHAVDVRLGMSEILSSHNTRAARADSTSQSFRSISPCLPVRFLKTTSLLSHRRNGRPSPKETRALSRWSSKSSPRKLIPLNERNYMFRRAMQASHMTSTSVIPGRHSTPRGEKREERRSQ